MANYPNNNKYHYPYIPAHMLQMAYHQKYQQLPHNPAPHQWMARYLDASSGRYTGVGSNIGAQLQMVVPNVVIREQGNRGRNEPGPSSRKRSRPSGSPHASGRNSPSHEQPKKKKVADSKPNTNSIPSTSTRLSDTERRTDSPSLEDKIALAVTDAYSSKPSAKSDLRVTVKRKSSKSGEITSNSVSRDTSERSTPSTLKPHSSSSSSHAQSSTPSPGTSSVKRKASVAALTNSAPPAVKVKHPKKDRTEQNSTAVLDTPTSSKQHNTRRNSLPAQVQDTLAEQILNRYHETKQQETDLRRKEDMRRQLENIIHEVMPYTMLFLVGSSKNCFGTRTSDADMCLMVTDGDMNQKRDAKNILYQLKDYLRDRCNFIKRLQVIPAKVPIIKFTHRYSGLECDLNINNHTGIRNTHLLQAYAKLDHRVAPLVLIVKQWASHCGINDASQGTLSSYSWVLMVLNYLQVGCNPPVLPALQEEFASTFNKFSNVRQFHGISPNTPLPSHIKYQSRNKQDVGALLRGFFEYYGKEFDFNTGVMSVRRGTVLHLNNVRMNGGDWLNKYIFIEEPFDLTNTARAVYKVEKFMRIKQEIRDINSRFRHGAPNDKISRILGL